MYDFPQNRQSTFQLKLYTDFLVETFEALLATSATESPALFHLHMVFTTCFWQLMWIKKVRFSSWFSKIWDCSTSRPSRLFVIDSVEIASSEGTTQGDPVVMAVYTIAIIPLISMILEITESYSEGRSKVAAYEDDLNAAGCSSGLKYWWDQLCELGPKFGYFPQAS